MLDLVLALTLSLAQQGGTPPPVSGPKCSHDHHGVTVLLNRLDRRDFVFMPLDLTQRFKRLEKLQAPETLDAKGAYKLLRYELPDSGLEALTLRLKRLDFKRAGASSVAVGQGEDTFGRSLEAKVVEPPDDVWRALVPVYSTKGCDWEQPVELGLWLDATDETVELRVLPDSIQRAIDRIQEAIGHELAQLGCPVFFGSPNV